MQKKITLIPLSLILMLNISCVENTSKEKVISKSDVASAPLKDTLKFTSGIRAIFQDSKGNYWFGTYHEGVARFDGTTFTYFTINEGLIDNQIHAIQEDNNGIIWFNTQKGVCSYDGQQIVSRANENDITMEQPLNTLMFPYPLWACWKTKKAIYGWAELADYIE
jgi:ligand-binding sensor domain-containing protein